MKDETDEKSSYNSSRRKPRNFKEYKTEQQILTYPCLPLTYCWSSTHLQEVTQEEVRSERWMRFLHCHLHNRDTAPKCDRLVLHFRQAECLPPLQTRGGNSTLLASK